MPHITRVQGYQHVKALERTEDGVGAVLAQHTGFPIFLVGTDPLRDRRTNPSLSFMAETTMYAGGASQIGVGYL